jgi:hypothetical protein
MLSQPLDFLVGANMPRAGLKTNKSVRNDATTGSSAELEE